jgi:hypothetical protein
MTEFSRDEDSAVAYRRYVESPPKTASRTEIFNELHSGNVAFTATAETSWEDKIHMMDSRQIVEITEEDYYYWLELLPPKLMARGFFCFAEGQEPLTIFWAAAREGRKPYLCRRMTWDQTFRFCDAIGISKCYG